MKQKILIITHSEDNPSTALVAEHLQAAGAAVIRFDVDTYPLRSTISSTFLNRQWRILLHTAEETHDLSDISALWYRRGYNLGKGLNEVLEKKFVGPAFGEIQHTIWGLIESFPCYQFGRVSSYRRMDSKEEQLKIAHKIGLAIPRTCITNDPATATAFVQECKNGAIAKMQSGFAIYEKGVEQVVFTNVVSEQDITHIDTLRYCPMQFQERIEKDKELRVTIIGKELFAFEIDSQQLETAKVDWRREGVKLIEDWKRCSLPDETATGLLQLMDIYGVDYGAIDLIRSPDGTYYFLEINAAGEYFWLDKLCDGAMSQAIAKVLMDETPRRGRAAY